MQEHHRARPLGFHPNASTVVRFEPFRLDFADGSLWREDEEVRLPPRALVILQHLVERAGRIVPKQALLDAAWKDAYVSETSLTEVIGIIRQALGDDPQKPRYIQTVHRRGYRFIAPIAIDAPSATPPVLELARPTPAPAAVPGAIDAPATGTPPTLEPPRGTPSPLAAPRAPARGPTSGSESGWESASESSLGSEAAPMFASAPASAFEAVPAPGAPAARASDARLRSETMRDAQQLPALDAPNLRETLEQPAGSLESHGLPSASNLRQRPLTLAIALAAAALVIAIAAGIWILSRSAPPAEAVVRLSLTLPPEQAPAPGLNAHPVAAISPDGTRIVYAAGTTDASWLYVRRMDQFSATPIPGTDGAHGPFISPDGRWVAFFADGKVKKVEIDRGDPQVICATPTGVGGVWLSNSEIAFAPDWTTPVMRVSANGGEPTTAAAPPPGYSYRWPDRVDNGTLLVTRWRSSARDAAVVTVDLASGKETIVAERAAFGRYAASGHVLFVRDSAVYAVRFDPATRRASGAPVQVADAVLTSVTGAAQFAISPSGTLIYIGDAPERSHRVLARVDAAGRAVDLPIARRAFRYFAVCGDRIALTIHERGQSDLWTGTLDRAALTRLTSDGTTFEPVWTPDCGTLDFSWNRDGVSAMYAVRPGSASAPQQLLDTTVMQSPGSWSADGRHLAYMQFSPKTGDDVWLLDLPAPAAADSPTTFATPAAPAAKPDAASASPSASASAPSRTTRPLVVTPGEQIVPRLSPDGRWVAYESDASGQFEVEVASVDSGARLQISSQGGTWPAWSADSRQLFYLDKGTIYRVAIAERDGELTPGNPVGLFSDPDIITFRLAGRLAGDDFVIVRRTAEHLPLTRLDLVLNWFTELRQHFR
jgi:DNA-binding winged helix-turn-helix (wHTH) protein/Tol biopolymer transport system component